MTKPRPRPTLRVTSARGCWPTATTPAHFLILAEFAEVDDEASSADEAELNNERQETQTWADDLRELVTSEPEWIHFDELYRTGITGDLRTG